MIAAALAAASLAFLPGTTPQSFESVKAVPTDWKLVEFTAGVSKASIRRGHAADGKQFLSLIASKANHTRLVIPATVEANATYRFSAMVRASGPQPVPALLALDGDDGTTTGNADGDGQWHERDLYVRTGSSTQIGLVLSLGWFGQTVAGDADFDQLQLVKVDAPPTGAPVAKAAGATAAGAPAAAAPAAAITPDPGPSKVTLPLVGVLLLLIAGTGIVLSRRSRADG